MSNLRRSFAKAAARVLFSAAAVGFVYADTQAHIINAAESAQSLADAGQPALRVPASDTPSALFLKIGEILAGAREDRERIAALSQDAQDMRAADKGYAQHAKPPRHGK